MGEEGCVEGESGGVDLEEETRGTRPDGIYLKVE